MPEYKCAFSNPLIGGQFGCENVEQVTRRADRISPAVWKRRTRNANGCFSG